MLHDICSVKCKHKQLCKGKQAGNGDNNKVTDKGGGWNAGGTQIAPHSADSWNHSVMLITIMI
jgi:hypothetical protein